MIMRAHTSSRLTVRAASLWDGGNHIDLLLQHVKQETCAIGMQLAFLPR